MDRFSQPSKPNTRIPPIIMARQTRGREQAKANVPPQDQFSRLAALSKQRLYREAQTGDPDLRRCIGHHRLLCRTIQEAKDSMKRYMDDVLESESDSDSDIEDEDEILYEKGPINTEYRQTEDEDVEEGLLFPPTKQQQPQKQLPMATTTTTTTITTKNDPSPSPCVKEKILGVVKGLVRRRSTPSRNAPPTVTAPAATAAALDVKSTPLVHISEKNYSCSQLPVRIHIHEDVVREGIQGLKRSHSQDALSTKSSSFGMRGRQYAQKLGIKVAPVAAVPVCDVMG
ncbi:hypothetical protein ASPSYDRAFT_679421 [Aspergillus sydowii CBS 593.65]|uniref:Uncharacterized protein n=1 Tax=Aspergillus sydowii CBS 593.65 TaxID=1036612 RepID=A0A1L9TUE2_9EURO|nr:uncharacterized protein ASPSYDRAFT_679421 [Aspergillus sydowii CBS 593.65]OJJ63031.1 hypothetical protein ASPSYDRAFT_679421 [Aspergillus sydowii CBS 593.65]